MRLAGAFERQVRLMFSREERMVLAAVGDGPAAMRQAVNPTRWEPVLAKVWLGQAPAAVWDGTLSELGGPKLDWRQHLPAVFGPHITEQAANICATTRDQLARALTTEKASAGEVYRKTVRRLYRTFRQRRAARVALGVVVQATAAVQHQAARTMATITRAEIVKTWVTVGDDRVRPSHVLVGGTTVPEAEPFYLAGGPLLYPRDPDGPAGEVMGCRCWAVYDPVGGHSTERGAVGRGTLTEAAPLDDAVDADTWRPSMTRAEAERWARDSEVKGDIYHMTKSGDAIRTEGFERSRVSHAGSGVYTCETEFQARLWEFYAEGRPGAGAVERVTLKARVKRVAGWNDAPGSPLGVAGDVQLVKNIDAGMPIPSHLDDTYIASAREAKEWADREGFTPVLDRLNALTAEGELAYTPDVAVARAFEDEGFDALRVSFSGASWDSRVVNWQSTAGGDQLLVFDPRKVVAVVEG